MKELIKKLQDELNSKPSPGHILNEITEKRLEEFEKNYKCDHFALWIGAYLADIMITEAIETGNIKNHIPMAIEYANKLFKEHNEINERQKEIILEIISSHHSNNQQFIESKLFKNADCFKFLEPKGVFHIFGMQHEELEHDFNKAIEFAFFKIKEKYSLVDLSEELKAEAKLLYDKWMWFFERMRVEDKTPDLYSK